MRHATSEQSYLEVDLTLGLPLRYGMGLMLGGRRVGLFGLRTPRAFGHVGFTNIFGWADPDRLAVIGGSYGGHLGAALTTRTDRFRAAALDRMFPETMAFWGTTDEKWFPEWEFGGRPWEPEAREIYRRNSP